MKFNPKYLIGTGLIVLGYLVWQFRPFTDCVWWNPFCNIGSVATAPIFLILSLVLIVAGIYKLIWGK